MSDVFRSTYVRWGRTECPGNRTEMVYRGFAGGARHDKGGAANYVCLPEEPIWGAYEDTVQDAGTISGDLVQWTSVYSPQ